MKGTIAFINEKEWNGKLLYSFKLQNDPTYYGCGTDKPLIKKGDCVEFDVRTGPNGRVTVDNGSIMVVKEGTDTPQIVTAKTPFKKFGKSEEEKDYWKNREARDLETQKRIQLQSSRNSAIALVDVLLKNNAVKLPEAPAKRLKPIMELLNETVEAFQRETNGDTVAEFDDEIEQEVDAALQEVKEEMGSW